MTAATNNVESVARKIGSAMARDTIADMLPIEWTGLSAEDADQIPDGMDHNEVERLARIEYLLCVQRLAAAMFPAHQRLETEMTTSEHSTVGLSRFVSSHDFYHRLACLDDKRCYLLADAIRSLPSPTRKFTYEFGGLPLVSEMRRLGLLDDTLHLSDMGVSIWNHLHS